MEFKVYYYEDANKCVICKKEKEKPEFNLVNNNESIVIDLDSKNVENIYDFFRNNVLKSLLTENDNITIDYSEIENEKFYTEDSFKKLVELINNLAIQANKSIVECSIDDNIIYQDTNVNE